ncbi:MAG: GH3 auxin-responsive promoter family protein, partial [Planctomycetota bacterium]|nr:GH3 auxin-responsive promoter family protein [Planctomycetota bacterium]
FVDTYSATEGGMLAVQDRADDPSLAVILDRSVFYEFVGPDERRRGIHEVEPDVPYRIVVTTDAGLWAYEIGDLVRFTSVKPPRIVFHGRKRFFLNAFGEHVSQGELERAVVAAADDASCEVAEFTVLPEFPDAQVSSGRHVFIIEFAGAPPDLSAFADRIDRSIARGNDDYSSHRRGDQQLRPPVVRLVKSGTFYKWMKSRGRLGGQNKVPRIVDAELAQGLLPGT